MVALSPANSGVRRNPTSGPHVPSSVGRMRRNRKPSFWLEPSAKWRKSACTRPRSFTSRPPGAFAESPLPASSANVVAVAAFAASASTCSSCLRSTTRRRWSTSATCVVSERPSTAASRSSSAAMRARSSCVVGSRGFAACAGSTAKPMASARSVRFSGMRTSMGCGDMPPVDRSAGGWDDARSARRAQRSKRTFSLRVICTTRD